MPIQEHPTTGSILMCDFRGFIEPEMVKRRPVIVLSPRIVTRAGLCTVVCLSTTPPNVIQPFHCQISIDPPLPAHFQSEGVWVKGDMVYSVSFSRLDLIRTGKLNGKRTYYYNVLSNDTLKNVRMCVLRGMGLSTLTRHLP